MRAAKRHVRFTPNSDIDCVFRHRTSGVYSITSLALPRSDGGTVRPEGYAEFLEQRFTSAPPSDRSSIRLISNLALVLFVSD
jgi:hypothetical protein